MTVLSFPQAAPSTLTAKPEWATAPESAAALKSALRKAFPATQFSVRLSRGTAYGYCDVRWVDGPTPQRVEAIAEQFRGSYYDGMQDCEISTRRVMPDGRRTGLRGVSCQRDISPAFARRVAAAVAAYWGGEDMAAPAIVEKDGRWSINLEVNHAAYARTGWDWVELIYQASRDRTIVQHDRS